MSSMSNFRRLLVFAIALFVALPTGSTEVECGQYPVLHSTVRTASTSPRCKPIPLAELKAMPFWQTFHNRLGVVVWGNPRAFDSWKGQGKYPKLDTIFDDGAENAEVCSEGTVVFQATEESLCSKTSTYTKKVVTGQSGTIRLDYPTGLSTVVAGTVTKVAAPLTGGRSYETAFKVPDLTPPGTAPGNRGGVYTVNAQYPDVLDNSFAVDVNHEKKDYMIIHELPGDICWLQYDNTTCIQEAAGQATFSLHGAVRVGFDSPQNGHYYWYMRFDGWVPQNQLTVTSQFTATITTAGSSRYIPQCNYNYQ
ncbi:hypothetical protein B0H12DRAFT_274948 [Mycena haematopus]|nr:hypothetical protein B0H12DRAFT_274948 [Mycena haematopus]